MSIDEGTKTVSTPAVEVEPGDQIWTSGRDVVIVQCVLIGDSVVHIVGQRAVSLEVPVTATVEVFA